MKIAGGVVKRLKFEEVCGVERALPTAHTLADLRCCREWKGLGGGGGVSHCGMLLL